MAPSFPLLGPPELHHQPPQPLPSSSPSPSSGDPFIDSMVSNFNKTKLTINPPRGLTENSSPTFMSTGNPCLDFFFHVVPNTPSPRLTNLLDLAWKHDDLTALKLICHLRGVGGAGKSDKEGFYAAALWLHKHHPKTLACNLNWMVQFGCFKDLPEILYRILKGPDVGKNTPKLNLTKPVQYPHQFTDPPVELMSIRRPGSNKIEKKSNKPNTRRHKVEAKKLEIKKQKARELRKGKEMAKARKAIEKYSTDPDYRFLHDQISQAFADYLVSDMKSLQSGDTGKISLASKWCPSLDSSYDKATLLCENIAKRVFPRESYGEIEEAHYTYQVRDRLRKEVLVPLGKVLELPEVYMSANKWDSLPYSRFDSAAMTNYKKRFLKHDENRFIEFLGKVERGEAKMSAEALLPHEIIAHLNDGEEDGGQVAELQWKRMVDDLSAKGKLKNCIAVLDVSASMKGKPMEVSVALGLLVSELGELPWKGKIITFGQNPQFHVIEGDDLRSKTEFIRNTDQSQNKDLQKVFDNILEVALAGSLSKEQMIKRVFVFSDMEFGAACGTNKGYNYHPALNPYGGRQEGTWNTDYEVIKKKFKDHGYMIPEIVFWNLRDSKATPVASDQQGVALVSGFSKNLLTLLLDEEEIGVKGPEAVMESALLGSAYEQLVVLD